MGRVPALATLAWQPVGAYLCNSFGFVDSSGPVPEVQEGIHTGVLWRTGANSCPSRRHRGIERLARTVWVVAQRLFKSPRDWSRTASWSPGGLAYALMRILGVPLPAPVVPVFVALALFLASFVGALGEELRWSGYAIDPLQHRWNALTAAIILGSVWAVWHLVPWAQAGHSPNYGCHDDPRFVGPIMVVAAMFVTFFWGSRTLTREASSLAHSSL